MEKNNESKVVKSKVVRILFLIVGFISLVLGTIGIIIPILPTVPFYLLTAFCFVRGSKRFADWFLNSKLYKNHIGNFANHRVMTIYGELILLSCVSAMLMVSMWIVNKLAVSIILTILIACKYSYFVFRITPIGKKEYIKIKEEDKRLEEECLLNQKKVEND